MFQDLPQQSCIVCFIGSFFSNKLLSDFGYVSWDYLCFQDSSTKQYSERFCCLFFHGYCLLAFFLPECPGSGEGVCTGMSNENSLLQLKLSSLPPDITTAILDILTVLRRRHWLNVEKYLWGYKRWSCHWLTLTDRQTVLIVLKWCRQSKEQSVIKGNKQLRAKEITMKPTNPQTNVCNMMA